MKAERWKEMDDLFHAALEQEPSGRAAFLSRVCGGDESLREEVESLLTSHQQAESFIEAPAADLAADLIAEKPTILAEGQVVGPYKIVDLLGAGGMGEVYLAQDTRLGRRVALKMLPAHFSQDPERLQRFEQEARAASMLNHPNIVTVHEIGQLGDAHFIVTEFIEGQTLRQQMTSAKIRLREALDVAIQVTAALGAAHKAGIAHRDIKPENIMLRPDGLVKVLDFGLAKLTRVQSLDPDDEASTLARVTTEAGLVMGTVTYMSPEQARGLAVDSRSDIFSLGVVLYEMVAGRAPFDGTTVSDVIAAILKEEPVPLKQYSRRVPAELEWVMKKALAKDREERYQTIRELQIDLKRLAQELQSQAKLEDIPSRRSDEVMQDSAAQTDSVGADSNVARTSADPRTLIIESEGRKRRFILNWMTIGAAVVVIAVFSVVSFFAGLRQATSSRPSFRQLTFRRGTITSARFVPPDGQTVVYGAAFGGRPIELFTSRLESPESGSLKLHGDIKSISPTGEMAILLDCELDWGECHNGTLARVPVVGGTPREIADNVYEADWSPDGKELAIVRVVDEKYQLEYPIGNILYTRPLGWIGSIRVSPKGDLVAFIDHPVLGQIEGLVMVVDLTRQTRVLSETPGTRNLSWSPTGDEIWYSAEILHARGQGKLRAVTLSGRERSMQTEEGALFIHDTFRDGRALVSKVQGGGSRMMAFSAGSQKEVDLSWFNWSTSADISADGKMLLFYEWHSPSHTTPYTYLRKLDGSNDPFRIGQGKALALSPDGKWAIALQEGPPPQLVLLPTGAGEQQALPRGNIAEFYYATWFPDGNRILFTGIAEGHSQRSYIQDVSSGQINPITDEGVIALLVSPEGKRLLTWAPDGRYYVAPTTGTAATPISGLDLGEVPIQWTADGRAVYVRGPDDSDVQIYRIELTDGRRKLWKDHIVPDPVGLMDLEVKPGGIKITPDGRSYVYTYWSKLDRLFLVEGLK